MKGTLIIFYYNKYFSGMLWIFIILTSKNGDKWKQVFRFHFDQRDTRDPHFLQLKGKLFIYTGT